MDEKSEARMAQYLTTEHFALQGARNSFGAEANGRLSMYFTAVSAGVVAMALITQVSGLGETFLIISLLLFPVLIYIGLATLMRLGHLEAADAIYTQAINRIRNYYVKSTPDIVPYLSLPYYDDNPSTDRARVEVVEYWPRLLVSAVGQVLLINSLLASIFIGIVAARLFSAHLLPIVLIGAGVFILSTFLHALIVRSMLRKAFSLVEHRFSPPA